MGRYHLKPIPISLEASSSIHLNVSKGYYNISSSGHKIFVPYDKNEIGEIHSFISPNLNKYRKMKFIKTRRWKDQESAKKSKWKYTPTFGGLNTVKK